MKRQFIFFTDGELQRKDNTICFNSQQGKIPAVKHNEIFLFREIDLNKRFLEFASQKILIHYFNYYGYYMGTFYP